MHEFKSNAGDIIKQYTREFTDIKNQLLRNTPDRDFGALKSQIGKILSSNNISDNI